jgi:hypothetical protein
MSGVVPGRVRQFCAYGSSGRVGAIFNKYIHRDDHDHDHYNYGASNNNNPDNHDDHYGSRSAGRRCSEPLVYVNGANRHLNAVC